jgi:dipeptidyl aminopeptidase/acylaminoacyl peptidase
MLDASEDATDLEELVTLPELYQATVSPDGTRIAFYWDESGRNELYVYDLETADYSQVTQGEVPRNAMWYVVWGSDSERIYFHDDDAGNGQNDISVVTMDGDVEVVVETDGQCRLQDVSPNGQYVLYASDEGEQLNLYRCDTDTGQTEQLTDSTDPISQARYAPDGSQFAYSTADSETEGESVFLADAGGNVLTKLSLGAPDSRSELGVWGPDGDRLLVGDDADGWDRVGIYSIDDHSVEWLGDFEYDETPLAFDPDGGSVLALRSRDAVRMPVRYHLEGDVEQLSLSDGVSFFPFVQGRVFDADRGIVLQHATGSNRKELLRYDFDRDSTQTLVEASYGSHDASAFVEPEYVTYESTDGLEIGGLLYDSGRRPSSGIVSVHGGPHGQARRLFNLRTQFLVRCGYTVFEPNYRGSTGYGRKFRNRVHNDWGGMEQADIAAAGEWLKDRDWIDPSRVAVLGSSYGGYSAYMQLVKYPDHWTTAVAWRGISDLPTLYEEAMPHIKSKLEVQMGDPQANADLWKERSPITHVERLERPLLILHGTNDPVCPISQARAFRDAIEAHGRVEGEDFEYHELDGQGHGSSDIEQKGRVFGILKSYLDERL